MSVTLGRMRALVTGATGFIGGHLVQALIARGDQVTALVRSPERAEHLKDAGVRLAAGDITEPPTLEEPMRDVDAVFHLAAWYELGVGDRAKMFQINVRGTEHVLDAAHAAGVARIVYCSSVAALGSHPEGSISDERTAHPGRFGSVYEETKWKAHQVVAERSSAGAPIVTVMPAAVFGPGDPSAFGALLRIYAKGWLIACPFQQTGFSWVPVVDLAAGILAAHDRGRGGEAYILGGENASIRELFATLGPITGIRSPRFEVPEWLVRASQPASPLIGKALGTGPKIVGDGLASMRGSWMADSAKAKAELGYTYQSIAEAMPATIEWFKES